MKNYILLLCFSFLFAISCSNDNSIEADLVGEWVYERETFISGSTFEDSDVRGIMTFNEDETGTWESDSNFNLGTDIEWDLQQMDSKIAITKILPDEFIGFTTSQIYDLKQSGNDSFTFTFEFTFDSTQDTFPSITRFENIILTRK